LTISQWSFFCDTTTK